MAKLKKSGFWHMQRSREMSGLDGAEWILEGSQNGQYQAVDTWSPESGDYRDVCLLFLELAGFSIPAAQTY